MHESLYHVYHIADACPTVADLAILCDHLVRAYLISQNGPSLALPEILGSTGLIDMCPQRVTYLKCVEKLSSNSYFKTQ